jgi:hypothetical protein
MVADHATRLSLRQFFVVNCRGQSADCLPSISTYILSKEFILWRLHDSPRAQQERRDNRECRRPYPIWRCGEEERSIELEIDLMLKPMN